MNKEDEERVKTLMREYFEMGFDARVRPSLETLQATASRRISDLERRIADLEKQLSKK